MNIASLSLPYGHRHTHSPVARAQSMTTTAPTPTQPAETAAAADATSHAEARHCCDSPRRSPLYQALVSALSGMATPAPANAPPAASADGPAPAGDSNAEPAPDIDSAVMDFAHALMQAMRGFGRADYEDGHVHAHKHKHEHHDHGRRAWGEPAQRIGQLGMQIGAPAPAAVDASAVPVAVDPVVDPAVEAASAPAVAAADPVAVSGTVAAGPSAEPSRQSRLLTAFGTLAEALGLPAATDGASLRSQLSSFLKTLAERLHSSTPAPLQPGALLDVTA